MKLERKYFEKYYRMALINQYFDSLTDEGFLVKQDFSFDKVSVDLYAKRGKEQRIYEFKLIRKDKEQSKSIRWLNELAKKIEAKPIIVYVNPPIEKNIEIIGLDSAIEQYLNNQGEPIVEDITSNASIEEVYIDDINELIIEEGTIRIVGSAELSVNLFFGSTNDGISVCQSFPMEFTLSMNCDLEIESCECDVDTSSWSE